MLATTALAAMRRIVKISTAQHDDEALRTACRRVIEPNSATDSRVAMDVLASWPDTPMLTPAVREFCRDASAEIRSEEAELFRPGRMVAGHAVTERV